MKFELTRHENTTESISSEKTELYKLEKAGGYLFHGSRDLLLELEPRQAHDTVRGKDGAPAVFASPKADMAIFHAIVHPLNMPNVSVHSGTSLTKNGKTGEIHLTFRVSESGWSHITDQTTGFVHVFRKEDFFEREPGAEEYVHERGPISPVKVLRVRKGDLPQDIEITPDPSRK